MLASKCKIMFGLLQCCNARNEVEETDRTKQGYLALILHFHLRLVMFYVQHLDLDIESYTPNICIYEEIKLKKFVKITKFKTSA